MLCGATPRMGCRISIEPGSRTPRQGRTSDRGDGLVWKWIKGERTEPADFVAPRRRNSLGSGMYEQSGEGPVAGVRAITVPGSECSGGSTIRSCRLRQTDRERWLQPVYVPKQGTDTRRIEQMVLKPEMKAKSRSSLKAKEKVFLARAAPWGLPSRCSSTRRDVECWEATYSEDGSEDNNPRQFKGTAD